MIQQLPQVVHRKKRRGRGIGGRGAKSGRGMKGQKSRAGYSSKAGFEGGQTPLYMRLPKGRGTKQVFASQAIKHQIISVGVLNNFPGQAIIGPGILRRAGLLSGRNQSVKLIGNQPVNKKLTVRVHAASAGAQKAVEAAGGKVEIISR